MKAKQGLKTGVVFLLALLLFGSCKEEELYTTQSLPSLPVPSMTSRFQTVKV